MRIRRFAAVVLWTGAFVSATSGVALKAEDKLVEESETANKVAVEDAFLDTLYDQIDAATLQLDGEMTLEELVQKGKAAGLPFWLDRRALDQDAIATDTVITFHPGLRISNSSRLKIALEQADLAILPRDEVIAVTTEFEADTKLVTRVYRVGSLMEFPDEPDYDTLLNLVVTSVQPDIWQDVGGSSTIVPYPKGRLLVISTTFDVHHQIGKLFIRLEKAMEATNPN